MPLVNEPPPHSEAIKLPHHLTLTHKQRTYNLQPHQGPQDATLSIVLILCPPQRYHLQPAQ